MSEDKTKNLTFPTIHLNGSSGMQLQEDLLHAANAIYEAREKLNQCAPHGRDYYVQGDEALQLAQEQFNDRVKKLNSIYEELYAIYNNIQEQVDARKRR